MKRYVCRDPTANPSVIEDIEMPEPCPHDELIRVSTNGWWSCCQCGRSFSDSEIVLMRLNALGMKLNTLEEKLDSLLSRQP